MDPPDRVERLKKEQLHAMQVTDQDIAKWEAFQDDYRAVKERLTTLPDKLHHDIMVPFGSIAFVPGRIVHTNKVLVLLGDNWFADRSAKQSCEIIDGRLKDIESQINKLKEQRKLLEARLDFTAAVADLQEAKQGQDELEIAEMFDSDEEAQWRVEREIRFQLKKKSKTPSVPSAPVSLVPVSSASVSSASVSFAPVSSAPVSSASTLVTEDAPMADGCLTTDDVWARLEQLEQLELKERGESVESHGPCTVSPTKGQVSFSTDAKDADGDTALTMKKLASFYSMKAEEDGRLSDDKSESEEDAEEEEIDSDDSADCVQTPSFESDAHKQRPLRSILKSSSRPMPGAVLPAQPVKDTRPPREAISFSKQAFGDIVDRPVTLPNETKPESVNTMETTSSTQPAETNPPRKVSRFKAKQMQGKR